MAIRASRPTARKIIAGKWQSVTTSDELPFVVVLLMAE